MLAAAHSVSVRLSVGFQPAAVEAHRLDRRRRRVNQQAGRRKELGTWSILSRCHALGYIADGGFNVLGNG